MTDYLTEIIDAARDKAITNRNVQRANLNFKSINSKLLEHSTTLATVAPVITNNTIPSNPTAVFGTNGGKVVDNVLLDTVTVQYTSPNPLGSFAGVFLVAKNYNGSATLVKIGEDTFHGAVGTTQSFVTILQRTNEVVTFFVVPKTATELTPTDWTTCPSFALTMNGLASAPPAPTFSQTLVATPTGYQFAFNQVIPTGQAIDSYKVYRNASFTTSGAVVIRTFKHDPSNTGVPITVQDVASDGVPYYYYVSTVNTSGLESTLAAAESGTVFATIPMMMKGAPVVLAPLVPTNALTSGGALGQWTAGLTVPLPGTIDFDVFSTGGLMDVLLWASAGASGPNGYMLRFDARTGHPAGQILKVTNGAWTSILGTVKAANNAVTLTGWHTVTVRVTGQGQFDIFVDGVWNNTAVDTTFAPTGATYYGYEATAGSTLAPPAFLGKTQDHLPDGSTYLRTPQLSGGATLALANPSFEASATLPPPGWVLDAGVTAAYDTSTPQSGSQSLKITAVSLFTGAKSLQLFPVRAGDVLKLSGYVNNLSNGAGNADLALYINDSSSTRVGFLPLFNNTNDSTWHPVTGTITVPSTGMYAFVYCRVDVTTSAEFDNIQLLRVSSLDDEVADGTTFGKVNQTALTSNSIDPSKSGVLAKGSTPVSLNGVALNGMTWATTSSSVTFSWVQTPIFRADGTLTGFITSGNQAITGLLASQSYTAYPYFDEPTQTMKWVGSELAFPTITSVGLNGTTQYITTTTSVNSLPVQFTLEAWIKTTSGTAQAIMSLFSPQTGTGAATHQDMELVMTSAGEIVFAYENASSVIKTVTTSGAGLLDGAWHHIAVVFATGGTVTIYVDTVSKGTGAALGAARNAGFGMWYHIGFAPFAAGWPISAANAFFNGSIAHAAIYTTASLTTAQLSNHFITGVNVGFPGTNGYSATIIADGAFFYWKLNDTSGTSAVESVNGNTGTYQAAPTLNQQAPVVVPSGSPAYMWPYKNYLCTQAQSLQSRIALSAGSLNPSTTASGGGSGGGGGAGGGGLGGCFSGNTRVRTNRGIISIAEIQEGDCVLTARGTLRQVVKVWRHEVTDADQYLPIEPGCSPIVQRRGPSGSWLMHDMGEGELVTLNHSLLSDGSWPRAYEIFAGNPVVEYALPVFNLEIEANLDENPLAPDTESSFALANGWIAHNSTIQPK